MFFKKKKKAVNEKSDVSNKEDLEDIYEAKSNEKSKLDNVSDELIAKAIKDLLSKEDVDPS